MIMILSNYCGYLGLVEGELLFNGCRVFVGEDKNVLGIDSGDGVITVSLVDVSNGTNCTLMDG